MDQTTQSAIVHTLETLARIMEQDSNAILSSVIEHKGEVGDSNAAYVALVSKLLTLAE